jgi:hypothetical protein
MKRVLIPLAAAIGLLALATCSDPAPEAHYYGGPPAAPAEADDYMIAAAHPLAAEAGLEILRDGGSAVDAAIAAELVLTLVEPQSSGIGGGAFMLHYDDETDAVAAYDGRETAPAGIDAEVFLRPDGTRRGATSSMPSSAASPWALRASFGWRIWPIAPTAGCPGPTCSRRRSASPRRGSGSRPAITGWSRTIPI